MELFVFVDAVQAGPLSRILCQFNPLAHSMPVEVIDQGADKGHAEMRLLRKQLDSGRAMKLYGHLKLYCGFCNFALRQFGARQQRRGAHCGLFGGGLLDEFAHSTIYRPARLMPRELLAFKPWTSNRSISLSG
jgi:hypothetical protein